ncbi:hypothetical protein Q8A73_011163 [Channa argus]|nr:hypothetical protein Q8A73_011163 [Channa argus]
MREGSGNRGRDVFTPLPPPPDDNIVTSGGRSLQPELGSETRDVTELTSSRVRKKIHITKVIIPACIEDSSSVRVQAEDVLERSGELRLRSSDYSELNAQPAAMRHKLQHWYKKQFSDANPQTDGGNVGAPIQSNDSRAANQRSTVRNNAKIKAPYISVTSFSISSVIRAGQGKNDLPGRELGKRDSAVASDEDGRQETAACLMLIRPKTPRNKRQFIHFN